MSRSVRRHAAWLVALGLASVAWAASTPAARAATRCGPAVTYLVWPHGHPRLPALDFGREPIPHVDVVAGTDLHIDAAEFLGWVTSGRSPQGSSPRTNPMCLAYDEPEGTAAGFASTRGAVRLVCRFPGRVRFTTRTLSATRQEMRTQLADGTLAAIAEAGPASTRVRYDGRFCVRRPAPRASR